jgi:hypothetical protein
LKKTKKYGKTNEEISLIESSKCREIVHEILNFGVSQHQIKQLIKLLALELENNDLMLKIVNAADDKKDVISKPTVTV